MGKHFRKYFILLISSFFVFIPNSKAITLDIVNWVDTHGYILSDGSYNTAFTKTYNNEYFLNSLPVFGSVFTPPITTDYYSTAFFANTSAYKPCNDVGYSFTSSLLFADTGSTFSDRVTNIYFNSNLCSITRRYTSGSHGMIDFKCDVSDINHVNLNANYIKINFTHTLGTTTSNLYIARYAEISCSSSTQTIIDNQINNTQQIISAQSETNDILSDDNVSGSISKGNDFFSDVTDTTPSGPIGSFLTMPLTFIRTLTNKSCSNLIVPLPFVDSDLTLPCMETFWNRMGSLKTMINLVWIAIVAVRILSGIFKLTVELVDTNPNKSDPIALKTWEL